MLKLTAVGAALAYGCLAGEPARAQLPSSPADEFTAWFNDPSRQWLATAHLQRIPDVAIPRLLEPGRAIPGPHGKMTAALLTLAKIGEPALPAIEERVRTIAREARHESAAELAGLIQVLGAIGAPAIPSLVRICEISRGWTSALDAIVGMEPRSHVAWQLSSPWISWRAADDRLVRIEQEIVPMLPRIEKLLERAMRETATAPPPRSAAYLLARWGTPAQRALGLQVLEDLARSSRSFHDSLESIRTLHALNAPATASLIRMIVPKVPHGDELRAAYLLGMGIALQRLGESDYGPLVDEAIRIGRPADRMDAATFLGETEDLSNVPRLIAMLEDATVWSGRAVANYARDALRRLTLQDLSGEPAAWRAWFGGIGDTPRQRLVEQWISTKRRQIIDVPIWEANEWIRRLSATRDVHLLPLIRDYLRRGDLNASATGPGSAIGGGGTGPRGLYGPEVVTLLLRMAQEGVPGAVAALDACLDAADPRVRIFGALALTAYDPQRAADRLAEELDAPEGRGSEAAEILVELGDSRGIPARIDALELGARIFGGGVSGGGDLDPAVRTQACRDLRVYTQQPLPCDPNAKDARLGEHVAAWRAWWHATGPRNRLDLRKARLDLQAVYDVRPVTIGSYVAR